MTMQKITPSEQTGRLLTRRDCVYLDGKCDCKSIDECKYLKEEKSDVS